MQIHHEITQGSDNWLAFRFEHNGASEAAAMLGLSNNTMRTELLKMKKFGLTKEFSDFVQKQVLDKGHEIEALARPIVEARYGIDLYPVTCSDGKLSASCDGRTLNGKITWECKQYSRDLIEFLKDGVLPEEHQPQCQQNLMVTGADVLYFTCSDGTTENTYTIAVDPDPEWFDRIRAGWEQFERDLAEYVPVQIDEKPAAKAVIELPALVLRAEGRLVTSNMEAFGTALTEHLKETRALVYTIDQDFADGEARAKLYRETCEKLKLSKQAMLAETVSIDEAFRMIDAWYEDLRTTALQIEKDVKRNKEEKQISMINAAKIEFTAHIAELEAGISPIRLTFTMPNFADAMKNKRLFTVMHDSVQAALANAKIQHSQIASGIAGNLNWLQQHDKHRFLLSDLQTIVYKASDDFKLLVESRIADHLKREAEKIEQAKAEAVRQEQARAATAATLEAAKVKAAEYAHQQSEQAALAEMQRKAAELLLAEEKATAPVTIIQTAAPVVQSVPASAPTMRLGQISERLGIALTAELLRNFGFEGQRDKNAMLYHDYQFPMICDALVRHIQSVAQLKAA